MGSFTRRMVRSFQRSTLPPSSLQLKVRIIRYSPTRRSRTKLSLIEFKRGMKCRKLISSPAILKKR